MLKVLLDVRILRVARTVSHLSLLRDRTGLSGQVQKSEARLMFKRRVPNPRKKQGACRGRWVNIECRKLCQKAGMARPCSLGLWRQTMGSVTVCSVNTHLPLLKVDR